MCRQCGIPRHLLASLFLSEVVPIACIWNTAHDAGLTLSPGYADKITSFKHTKEVDEKGKQFMEDNST